MLGPIAGGLIVGYLHWRFIFFVNIPIGLAGLVLVYLHLPDYRARSTDPLDVVGLILFGSGIALLSYVLEIFGEHTLSAGEMSGTAGDVARAAGGLRDARDAARISRCCDLSLFRHPHVPRGGERQLLHAAGHRRRAVSAAAALPGGAGIHADSIGSADHAAGDRRHEHEDDHAAAFWRAFGYRGVLISNTVILGVC